jgi:hypothetical protein
MSALEYPSHLSIKHRYCRVIAAEPEPPYSEHLNGGNLDGFEFVIVNTETVLVEQRIDFFTQDTGRFILKENLPD